jgi:hypothetical protein
MKIRKVGKLTKKEQAKKTEIKHQAEMIMDNLYEYINDTRDLSVDESVSEAERVINELLALMHVATKFAAGVIKETSGLNKIDINIVYEDFLEMLDMFMDDEDAGHKHV